MRVTWRMLFGASVACAVLLAAGLAQGEAACERARQEVARAQRALSQATRDSDARGAAYHACMQKHRNASQACRSAKRRYDRAVARKRRASEAFRFAVATRDAACR